MWLAWSLSGVWQYHLAFLVVRHGMVIQWVGMRDMSHRRMYRDLGIEGNWGRNEQQRNFPRLERDTGRDTKNLADSQHAQPQIEAAVAVFHSMSRSLGRAPESTIGRYLPTGSCNMPGVADGMTPFHFGRYFSLCSCSGRRPAGSYSFHCRPLGGMKKIALLLRPLQAGHDAEQAVRRMKRVSSPLVVARLRVASW